MARGSESRTTSCTCGLEAATKCAKVDTVAQGGVVVDEVTVLKDVVEYKAKQIDEFRKNFKLRKK